MSTEILISLVSGSFAAAVVTNIMLFIKERQQVRLSLRWVETLHFDCFQDLSDCAAEFMGKKDAPPSERLGPFPPRLRQELQTLRDGLKVSSGLSREQFLLVHASLSEAEQVLFVNDLKFEKDGMAEVFDRALTAMRITQNAFNKHWPKYRTYAEGDYMLGIKTTRL